VRAVLDESLFAWIASLRGTDTRGTPSAYDSGYGVLTYSRIGKRIRGQPGGVRVETALECSGLKSVSWKRLVHAGVEAGYSEEAAGKIELTNKLSLALAAIIAGTALLFYGIGHDVRVLLYLGVFAFGPFVSIFLNGRRWHQAAKLFSAALYTFIIVFFSCLWGQKAAAHINLIVFVAYPFLIFTPEERWSRLVAVALPFAGYLLLQATNFSMFFSLHLPEGLQNILGAYTLGILIVENLVVVSLFVRSVETAKAMLAKEKARSEDLLLNVLPCPIADRLKAGETVIADDFASVSVLFADIAGFTPMTAEMSATEVVQMLDELFSRLDDLVDHYGLEKIKTIGDCYMVAAGIPAAREDHALVLARLALDIQRYVAERPIMGRRINLRIGINSGPIVAGVIGRRKFIYDLWGDTVNTASRMESHGVPGEIQVTRPTYELIQNHFEFESRGVVDIKGKGPMEVFLLRNSSTQRSPALREMSYVR